MFRACAGKPSETLAIPEGHGASVYEALSGRYAFPMPKENVHLAVNDEYAPWDMPLRQGDRVVFIPPVSGG